MLDTGIVGALLANNGLVRTRLNAVLGSVGISVIVVSEVRYGIAKSRSGVANGLAFDRLLLSGLSVAPFDADDAATAGTLRATLERAGKTMGLYDILIAAQALRIGATLITKDSDFTRVNGLKLDDWTKP